MKKATRKSRLEQQQHSFGKANEEAEQNKHPYKQTNRIAWWVFEVETPSVVVRLMERDDWIHVLSLEYKCNRSIVFPSNIFSSCSHPSMASR